MANEYMYFNMKNDPEIAGVNDILMLMLDQARHYAEIPFVITSGLRTPEHNAKVGGIRDSAHLKGLAVDISCRESKARYAIVYGLMRAGFKRIVIEKNCVHADIDETKPKDVLPVIPW